MWSDEIKLPRGEILWVTYCKSGGKPMFFVTSNQARDLYFLYEIQTGGKLIKIGKGKTPLELDNKFQKELAKCK